MDDELKKKLHDIERRTQVIVLSNESLSLQPNIFNGVLLGVIRRETYASDFSVGWVESLINRC